MDRVSVEVWQQILLQAMETHDSVILATRCTPTSYNFLCFIDLHCSEQRQRNAYRDYLAQRRCLRLVCHAWSDFVLFTSHRWLQLNARSPMFELDLTTTARAKGGVGPVEILSTTINSVELVTPTLSWVSHILRRPASQSSLRAYILQLHEVPVPGYSPLDDLFVGPTTTQDPECTITNTTLRSLVLSTTSSTISISCSQISRTFTGLRSLFLDCITATPQQTITLAHLEVLCVNSPSEALQQSMGTWDTPALRHVYLGYFATPLTRVLDRFLGRYAHQIESLILGELPSKTPPLVDLSSGFWAQFTVLCLLGMGDGILDREDWSGWSVVPPPTHPCQYLVRILDFFTPVGHVVNDIHSRWTWHDGVRLVAVHGHSGDYHVVKNMGDDSLIASMERGVGILPEW
jgi:hypothetical protein